MLSVVTELVSDAHGRGQSGLTRHKVATLIVIVVCVLMTGMFPETQWVWSFAVLWMVSDIRRRSLVALSVGLYAVAFPPFSWPTWWLCFVPLVAVWRARGVAVPRWRVACEGLATGFSSAWLSTGFVREAIPKAAWLLHGVACVVIGCQFALFAMGVHFTRQWNALPSAIVTSAVGFIGETLIARLGSSAAWCVTSISLGVANTPIAQCAEHIGQIGVSGLIYLVNALLVWDRFGSRFVRWLGPVFAVVLITATWSYGVYRISHDQVNAPPFSAMLVQPHLVAEQNRPWLPATELDRLTRSNLEESSDVDLIVWPETSLNGTGSFQDAGLVRDGPVQTLSEFATWLHPAYQTNCLVGVSVQESETIERYGLEVSEGRVFNCGCVVTVTGDRGCHEKIALVPIKEGLPEWLKVAWVRSGLHWLFELASPITPGREFRLLRFQKRNRDMATIAVSICYESFLPWLPQYKVGSEANAVIHLIYDGDSVGRSSFLQRQILACQYRAIESRKWNLVCSTWTGSAIIDPRGKRVAQLSTTAGVLRTDQIPLQGIQR